MYIIAITAFITFIIVFFFLFAVFAFKSITFAKQTINNNNL